VIDSVVNVLFGCRHRRTTFPLTPAKKGSSEPVETYVVCLECGKQFTYDWENMRLGKPADISEGSIEAYPEAEKLPFKTKSKARYVLLASALPAAAWLIRGVIKSRKKSRAAASSSQDGHDSKDENT